MTHFLLALALLQVTLLNLLGNTAKYKVTAAQIPAIEQAAAADGWTMNAAHNEVTNALVTLDFTYSDNVLAITIGKKPFYVENKYIWGEVAKWMQSAPTAY